MLKNSQPQIWISKRSILTFTLKIILKIIKNTVLVNLYRTAIYEIFKHLLFTFSQDPLIGNQKDFLY